MNILYLNHYAGSPGYGMEFRPFHMAQEWRKLGHQVAVLAAAYSHVRARQPDVAALRAGGASVLGRSTREVIEDIDYYWYAAPPYAGNGVGRVKNIAVFLSQIWRDAAQIVATLQPQAVIASSTYPLDIWVAHRLVKLARKRGHACRLVYEVHDLWPLSPIELGGMSPRHPFILLCQAAENYAYRHADAVVSMLPKVHEHMAAHGLNLDKLTIVPNGVVEEDWADAGASALPSGSLKDFFASQHAQGRTVVGYAGAHGQPNALEYLLEAAKLLAEDNIVFALIGSGLEKTALQQQAARQQLTKVHFFDPVPKNQIPALLAQFDIAYIAAQESTLYRFGISPNKLMDYMMAGKPIVCAIAAGNDPVAEAECGLSVAPANPPAIAAAIRQLAALSSAERARLGANGKAFVLREHTYSVLAQKFFSALQA